MKRLTTCIFLLMAFTIIASCAPTSIPEISRTSDETESSTTVQPIISAHSLQDQLPAQVPSESELPPHINTEELRGILDEIIYSKSVPDTYPAYIYSADKTDDGYILTLDRLEINDNFEPGAQGEDLYYLNAEEKNETFICSENTMVEYDFFEDFIDEQFVEYLTTQTSDGHPLLGHVYTINDEILLIYESQVP